MELDDLLDQIEQEIQNDNSYAPEPPQQQSFPSQKQPQSYPPPQQQSFPPQQQPQSMGATGNAPPPSDMLAKRGTQNLDDLKKQLDAAKARKAAAQNAATLPKSPSSSSLPNASEWKQATAANGKVYYYNTRTKETRWTNPFTDGQSASTPATTPATQAPRATPPQATPAPQPTSPALQRAMSPPPQQRQVLIPAPAQNTAPTAIQRAMSPPPQQRQVTPAPAQAIQQPISRPPLGGSQLPSHTNVSIPLPNKAPMQQPQPVQQTGFRPGAPSPAPRIDAQPWFFGALSRQQAEEMLARTGTNCFLVRNSSQEGNYACSVFEMTSRQTAHELIVRKPNGYSWDQEAVVYPDLIALITNSPNLKGYIPARR